MARLEAGKLELLKRKLHLSVCESISVANETDETVEYEVEENPDGSKPSILIRLKQVLKRE